MDLRSKIEVMQAFARGEEIEQCERLFDNWYASPLPSWNWKEFDYRIKPKEPVYEYQYAFKDEDGNAKITFIFFKDCDEFIRYSWVLKDFQRLDFTKRERKL